MSSYWNGSIIFWNWSLGWHLIWLHETEEARKKKLWSWRIGESVFIVKKYYCTHGCMKAQGRNCVKMHMDKINSWSLSRCLTKNALPWSGRSWAKTVVLQSCSSLMTLRKHTEAAEQWCTQLAWFLGISRQITMQLLHKTCLFLRMKRVKKITWCYTSSYRQPDCCLDTAVVVSLDCRCFCSIHFRPSECILQASRETVQSIHCKTKESFLNICVVYTFGNRQNLVKVKLVDFF